MKTIQEITEIIASAISKAASNVSKDVVANVDDYNIIVCTERIFNDDYAKPKRENLMRENRSSDVNGEYEYTNPVDMPYQNTIFIVIKFGQGQINKSVLNMSVTLECLSEADDFTVANAVLREFCNIYNFEYTDGIVMSFYPPSVSSSAEEFYNGFRTLLNCSGNIKVAEEGVVFVTEIWCYDDKQGDEGWFKIPFISLQDTWNTVTDPQSFSGYNGRTMNINRQSTNTISFDTYLFNYSNKEITNSYNPQYLRHMNNFSQKILLSALGMNNKYRMLFKTNIIVSSDKYGIDEGFKEEIFNDLLKDEATTDLLVSEEKGNRKYYLPSCYGTFTLINKSYSQAWGDINTWSLSFSESKKGGDE